MGSKVSEAAWMADIPTSIDGQPVRVIHAESDKLWLESIPDGARAGASVQLHKHADLDPSAWHEALQQIALVLPCVPPMELVDITPETWQHAVMAKPPKSASGPDGVSRLDLQLLPRDLVVFLLEICREAERQGVADTGP